VFVSRLFYANVVIRFQQGHARSLQALSVYNNQPELLPDLVALDFWESYDPDEVCNTGFSLIGCEPFQVRAVCFLCGSAGTSKVSKLQIDDIDKRRTLLPMASRQERISLFCDRMFHSFSRCLVDPLRIVLRALSSILRRNVRHVTSRGEMARRLDLSSMHRLQRLWLEHWATSQLSALRALLPRQLPRGHRHQSSG